jgi:hypothetical protein
MSVHYKRKAEVVMTTQIKSMLKKTMAVGLVAGALSLAGAVKADAQQFAVGVQFGTPVYGYAAPAYGSGYYANDYYARQRYERERREAFERRQAWLRQQQWMERQRHEAWAREHRYHDRDYRR